MGIPGQKQKASRKNIKPPLTGILLKDWISGLPSEILFDILSQLETKEAGRTSILSRRWRYMWTQISDLDFDAGEVLDELDQKIKHLEVERRNYISRVNQVLRCHQGQTIEQLVVVFDLDKSSGGSDIDNWVSFAIRKKVQRLKLSLRDYTGCTQKNHYSFPNSLEISSCRSLTSLHLDDVDITGEMLQLFLYNCLDLESVYVRESSTLLSLNVDGPPLLKLKWLELEFCQNIKCLNVSAPNLVSFKYRGPTISMPLKNVPKLLEISITGHYSRDYFNHHLSELFSYFSQLEKLSLDACLIDERHKTAAIPVLPKLKHLTLIIGTGAFKCLLDCASMIHACPSLYKFSFECRIDYCLHERHGIEAGDYSLPHNNIRVVEFNGFRGRFYEISLAKYLIKNAVMLEKITFDAISPLCKGTWMEFIVNENQTFARERAREVGKTLPSSVELVIA